jgi:hypothetical protein
MNFIIKKILNLIIEKKLMKLIKKGNKVKYYDDVSESFLEKIRNKEVE